MESKLGGIWKFRGMEWESPETLSESVRIYVNFCSRTDSEKAQLWKSLLSSGF